MREEVAEMCFTISFDPFAIQFSILVSELDLTVLYLTLLSNMLAMNEWNVQLCYHRKAIKFS